MQPHDLFLVQRLRWVLREEWSRTFAIQLAATKFNRWLVDLQTPPPYGPPFTQTAARGAAPPGTRLRNTFTAVC
jgi:hypothetical protein